MPKDNRKTIVGLLTVAGIMAGLMFGAVRVTQSSVKAQLEPIEEHIDHKIAPVSQMATRNREAIAKHEDEIDEVAEQLSEMAGKQDLMIEMQGRILDRLDAR